ncbi:MULTISPECIES: transporter substrate-binding domain-containing protein [unclassified Pantoea]|uniref:transporter substrate-binding domain-containing protein n=1 Tax=unclassified Pantoea TaxID=2630326 RepID=UPI0001E0AB39|nr:MULTISPECIES: transporter substrate-binding domain-containing protein [unclassified Pantoea]EFM21580.1 extracellular solute-binding protein family 3 [Pantoea sp. aB]QNQ60916.1 transporter substrate-binding domain-containing protein [Pantoea sp. MT58]
MHKKTGLLTAIIIFVSFPAASAVRDALRIGADLTNPPFQYREKNGEPGGFEIDVTKAVCKSVNVRCIYVVNTFDAQIPALLARKVDVILPLGVTRKRQDAIDFSRYVFHLPTRLVARKEIHLLPETQSLRGKNIAVQQGSIQEAYADKYWRPAGVFVKNYPDLEAIYEDLYAGRVEGALVPSVALTYGFLRTPQGIDFELKGPEVTDADLFSRGSAYGIRQGDSSTKRLLNKGLENIIRNGTYSVLQKRYFDNQDLSVKNP